MKQITVTVAIENELYNRAMGVNLAVSEVLYDFLLDEGIEYLEEEVEDLESVIDLTDMDEDATYQHKVEHFICPNCQKTVEVLDPVEGHHAVCHECGKAFEIG